MLQNKNGSVYEGMTNAELKVSKFLTDNDIYWKFEQAVYITDDKGRPRVWTPDFYLPELGIYVEVCGTDKFDYEFRKNIYYDNKIPIIFVHAYKEDKWGDYLIKEIQNIHEKRWELIKSLDYT